MSTHKRESSRLLDSPLTQVWDVLCQVERSSFAASEFTTRPQIVLPRRGVFVVDRRGEQVVADTNAALVLGLDEEYRVSHPTCGGDECTVLIPPLDVLEQITGGTAGRIGNLASRDHLALCLVTRALRDPSAEQLDLEDASAFLLGLLARAFKQRSSMRAPLGPGQRLRVEHARAMLASSPGSRWDLSTLGSALGCSPFHLARQFRVATGETISRYVLRLRLAQAVERLADGERNLAALAIGLGFSHHSHFTARFHRTLGMTPARAREILTKRKLAELRALFDAPPAR